MVEVEVNSENPPVLEENLSELEKKIIRQIEYYFGDINLARDKFLQEQVKLDDGWVPMETMLKFNRLSNLSKETEVITKAISKSSSKLMEISEDNLKIRRSPKLPLPEMNEGRRKELMSRSVYCKGFPVEDTTIHQLLDFFPKFGEIDNVIMRSYNDKATSTWKFKGSVFVIFSTVQGAQDFLNLESVKYNDTELVKLWQCAYLDEKKKETKGKKKNKKSKDNGDEENKDADENKNEDYNKKDEFPRGTVIQLVGLEENNKVTREEIRATIEKLGVAVGYIQFQSGDKEAWIRLDTEGSALELAGLLKGGVLELSSEVKVELRVIEGEEEETFLNKCWADKKNFYQRSRNKARRGKPFSRKRKGGSPSRDGRNKMQKRD